jgi:hypothetical protein
MGFQMMNTWTNRFLRQLPLSGLPEAAEEVFEEVKVRWQEGEEVKEGATGRERVDLGRKKRPFFHERRRLMCVALMPNLPAGRPS